MKYWFALVVKPRHEKAVSAALRSKTYEEFLPLCKVRRQWSDRNKVIETPLLPGYAFCRFDPKERVAILRTPGVRKIVSRGAAPVPVEEAEIQSLQAIVQAGLDAAPCPYLRAGESVSLERGPLHGLSGILQKSKGRSRLIISITLLQRSVAVEVEQAWISAADRSRALRNAVASQKQRHPDFRAPSPGPAAHNETEALPPRAKIMRAGK